MNWKHLAIVLAVFSVLFWIDWFVSIGQAEINPLYQGINKFIFFPIIVISVILTNKFWGNSKAMKFVPVFLISMFAFAFVWNAPVVFAQSFDLGFETVTSETQSYCKQDVFGCSLETKSSVLVASDWNQFNLYEGVTFATDIDSQKLVADHKTEGQYAQSLWFVPAGSCQLNLTGGASCDNTTEGISSGVLSPITELPNENYVLTFDSSVNNFYPEQQGDGLLQDRKHYGFTCVLETGNTDELTEAECQSQGGNLINIDAYGKIEIIVQSGNFTIQQGLLNTALPSEAGFQSFEIDLEPFLPSGSSNISLQFSVSPPSTTWQFPVGWTIDNIKLEPKITEPSPAEAYIEEMVNLTEYPSTVTANWGYNDFSSKVSRSFGNVALGHVAISSTCGGGIGSAPIGITTANIVYTNGTTIDVSNYTAGFDQLAGGSSSSIQVGFPIIDIDNFDHMEFEVSTPQSSCATPERFNVSYDLSPTGDTIADLRQTFGSNLDGTSEDLFGEQDLFPFVLFDSQVFTNGTQSYSIYSLSFQNHTFTNDNVLLLFQDDGTTVNFATDNHAITTGFPNVPSGITTPQPLDYQVKSTDWLSGSSFTANSVVISKTIGSEVEAVGSYAYHSNVSTIFTPAEADVFSACQNFCDGTTLKTAFATSSGGIEFCFFTDTPNEASCIAEVTGVEVDDVTDFGINNTQVIGGAVVENALASTGFGFLGIFLTPLGIFFFIILGIGAYLEFKIRSNGVILLMTLIGGSAIGWLAGILPDIVAVILIVMATGMTVWLIQKGTGLNIGRGS